MSFLTQVRKGGGELTGWKAGVRGFGKGTCGEGGGRGGRVCVVVAGEGGLAQTTTTSSSI
jgi:hypothetical protein